jgi:hypothetical protein
VNSLALLPAVLCCCHLDLYHVTHGSMTATICNVEIGPK